MKIGLDIGSTTLKCVVLNSQGKIVYKDYQRHCARTKELLLEMLLSIMAAFPDECFSIAISGSAGMGLAEQLNLPFVQEVYATRLAMGTLLPEANIAIELGGEDAKILFLRDTRGKDSLEVRMNGTCAGGTGAFIDQMASLLNISPDELNELSKDHEKIYTVASRCGVFAKSDIQPLINQGARKSDIAASIFAAVVNQTIAGLAQGRAIEGTIAYLGGPLSFLSELRGSFDSALNTQGICPENSLYFVAYGTALKQQGRVMLPELVDRIRSLKDSGDYQSCAPLFENQEAYAAFVARHRLHGVPTASPSNYIGKAYIGVDAGSTTVKSVAVDASGHILLSDYAPNNGDPIPRVQSFLAKFYKTYPKATVAAAVSTGYGEEMMCRAFRLDDGIVETIAHFTAAKAFQPDVDFIIDIGGQDIKCFHIHKGVIDNIFLNEACSSGCGSFLQTFAAAWGLSTEQLTQEALKSDKPVDLGSRCTVFMNSSVKQAQKDGASLSNIAAGLAISVVKNALYKVIRATTPDELGKRIVVQGGTFLNDAVLRAFEMEIGCEVVRPNIAGLMGAYGAALHAKSLGLQKSAMLTAQELAYFTHTASLTTCKGCTNHCSLTVNHFSNGEKFISGNRCERPLGGKKTAGLPNLFADKRRWLKEYTPVKGTRGRIGLPLGLNLYEMLPFWHTLFTKLGFEVITSGDSSRELYLDGQHTLPSDTICYPAKLMHGHIEALLRQNVDTIFYPCLTYNVDEGKGDNHFNCPVVAYYPEVIRNNMPSLHNVRFLNPYLGLHRKKDFTRSMTAVLRENFGAFTKREVASAIDEAFAEYERFLAKVRKTGLQYIAEATLAQVPVIVLAGRPYHIDEEICHGIDRLIGELGAVVVSEDAVSNEVERFDVNVLNQWTYHSRLYAAAKFVSQLDNPLVNLVQLVSFGCGVDAITTDETRDILEESGHIYTQIKIDEIANLGAVKIRLRSLFAAINREVSADVREQEGGIHSGNEAGLHHFNPKYAASTL